ncbi:MAG: hypothetical protein KDE27_32160 [Planctomycetes bacterium]|nr:hypothetical protein [Planctomycetota bacterium]
MIATVAIIAAAALAVVSLLAWTEVVHVPWIRGSSGPAMVPLTAVMILGLCTDYLPGRGIGRACVARAGTLVALTIVLVTLVEYAFDLPPSIERLLLFENVTRTSSDLPGRPSLHTIVAGGLLATGQLLRGRMRERLHVVVKLAGMVIPWLALFGYASQVNVLFRHPAHVQTGMSWATATALLAIGGAGIALHMRRTLLAPILSRTSGGRVLRVLLPLSVAAPLLVAAILTSALADARLQPRATLTISWGLTSILIAVAVFGVGWALARGEVQQRYAERARRRLMRDLHQRNTEIAELNDSLERRVEAATTESRERSTSLAAANAVLEQRTEALEQSNLQLQQFAFVASHDLQTPLRSISGFLQLLEDAHGSSLDESSRDWIARSVRAAERMKHLIDNLLTYSRIGSRAERFEAVDLDSTLETVTGLLHDLVAATEASITHEPLPTVEGDPNQLAQVLQNLLENAIKYRRPGEPPRVHVSACRDGEEWIVAVQDHGIGIAPDQRERVFEIFKRLHTQQEYPGTGIGLALVRRILYRHGGRVWIDAGQDGSTVVRCAIPVSRQR